MNPDEYPKLDLPHPAEYYHEKWVALRIRMDKRTYECEGQIFVGANSKWMRIDVIVEETKTSGIARTIIVDREMLATITPLTGQALAEAGRITFAIPQVLVVVSPA